MHDDDDDDDKSHQTVNYSALFRFFSALRIFQGLSLYVLKYAVKKRSVLTLFLIGRQRKSIKQSPPLK